MQVTALHPLKAPSLHSAPTDEAAVLVQPGASLTLRSVTARTRPCIVAHGGVIDLHHSRVTSQGPLRHLRPTAFQPSRLGSKTSTALGGGDGCFSHSHRSPFQVSRNYCEIDRPRFIAIISARDTFWLPVSSFLSQRPFLPAPTKPFPVSKLFGQQGAVILFVLIMPSPGRSAISPRLIPARSFSF